jgi:type II secretory pathway component PulF
LSKGRQFYETFARYPRTFSPVFVNLVRAAEASGNLQKTFEDLSVSLQREVELRNRIRSALIYPIILLVVALSISMFLVVFAIPRIAGVFQESGITPPLFSRIVFGIGLFLNEHIIAVVVVLAIIAGPMVYFFWRTDIGRRAFSRGLGQLPVIKGLYRDIAIQQFATTFSALMKAGLPIVQATRITASVVGSEEFRASLTRIADEGLSKGLTIGEAFRRETVFPRVVTNLVAISEKAGHLSEVLDTLSEFYISNIDSKVRSLVAVLEPVLLMLMGLLVGAIALAIIVPIYELTTQF